MISSSPPGTFRCGSVSSIRSSIQSPRPRLATALSALPTCREPVGLGAKRTLFIRGPVYEPRTAVPFLPARSAAIQGTLAAVEGLLLGWFAENGRDLPWRRTRDPYAILVSEVMLQQTQVERVLPRYLKWLERWPTVEALAETSPAAAIREWQGLGYNRRGLNLYRAAQQIAAAGWPS